MDPHTFWEADWKLFIQMPGGTSLTYFLEGM